FISQQKVKRDEVERRRQLSQLAGDVVARAGAAGFTVKELLEAIHECLGGKSERERREPDEIESHAGEPGCRGPVRELSWDGAGTGGDYGKAGISCGDAADRIVPAVLDPRGRPVGAGGSAAVREVSRTLRAGDVPHDSGCGRGYAIRGPAGAGCERERGIDA